jgi:O-antigen ligase
MWVPLVVFASSLAFDARRWRGARPRTIDLPVVVLGAVPFLTALSNDMGPKEAISATLDQVMTWGLPYALGRVYFTDRRHLRQLADALVIATLVYVPLCLWEIRMSPMTHQRIYGFRSFGFDQVLRFGGYRPSGFMEHGLALGMFMAAGAIAAYWLWRTDPTRRILRLHSRTCAFILVGTTLLVKSTGAIILLGLAIAALELMRRARTPLLLLLLLAVPPAYCVARISGWNAESVVALTREKLDPQRAESLQFRIKNEARLIEKAMIRPVLGWGRFGRSFVYLDDGTTPLICDSMWIIAVGVTGLVGLVSEGLVLLLPAFRLWRAYPARRWADPRIAPVAALVVILVAWCIDDLLNAMMAPIYPLFAGAVISFLFARRAAARVHAGRPVLAPPFPARGLPQGRAG